MGLLWKRDIDFADKHNPLLAKCSAQVFKACRLTHARALRDANECKAGRCCFPPPVHHLLLFLFLLPFFPYIPPSLSFSPSLFLFVHIRPSVQCQFSNECVVWYILYCGREPCEAGQVILLITLTASVNFCTHTHSHTQTIHTHTHTSTHTHTNTAYIHTHTHTPPVCSHT